MLRQIDPAYAAKYTAHMASPVHAKLVAAGWKEAGDWCVCYHKDNGPGFLLLSATDWEGDEFNFETVFVAQCNDQGDELAVVLRGVALDCALAQLEVTNV